MKLKIPKVGMRTIKTAVAVMLSYLLFVPFDLMYREEYGGIWGQMGPLYACIACIVCMQSSLGQTVRQGVSRLIGVAIGGALGVLALTLGPVLSHPAVQTLTLGAVCVAGIWTGLLLKRPAACPCLHCAMRHSDRGHTGVERYYYAAARIIETVVGVAVAFGVNALLPDHRRAEEPTEKPADPSTSEEHKK